MEPDSASFQQEPADAQVDSLVDGQEADGSRTDEATSNRVNGLMRLVGRRTAEAEQQKARADRVEAELAAAREALAAYEAGSQMTDAEAEEVEDATDAEEQVEEQAGPPGDESDGEFSFWMPGAMHAPGYGDPATYIDPNSVSRASSLLANAPSETQRLRTKFDRELDTALGQWGVEGRD